MGARDQVDEEFPSVDCLVTCHRDGCGNEGISLKAPLPEPVENAYVVCGGALKADGSTCGERITDIIRIVTTEPVG